MVTSERLREIFTYDEGTGIFTRKERRGKGLAGPTPGCVGSSGYPRITIDGKSYLVHRLVWLYCYGTFPPHVVDHINGIKTDNRRVNLRQATQAENSLNMRVAANNTSGFKGVAVDRQHGGYQAAGCVGGKRHFLGRYKTADAAGSAYLAFAKANHGEFYRDN